MSIGNQTTTIVSQKRKNDSGKITGITRLIRRLQSFRDQILFPTEWRAKRERRKRALWSKMKDRPSYMRPIERLIFDKDGKIDELKDKRIAAFVRYYDYTRKEIDREDGITFTRLNITLTFQAFLIGATGFIFSALATLVRPAGAIQNADRSVNPNAIQEALLLAGSLALVVIAIVGLVVSHFSYLGVKSSRKSLHWAKDMWIHFNNLNGNLYPSLVPQLTKYAMLLDEDRPSTDQGSDFALSIPKFLRIFWIVILAIWLSVFVFSASRSSLIMADDTSATTVSPGHQSGQTTTANPSLSHR